MSDPITPDPTKLSAPACPEWCEEPDDHDLIDPYVEFDGAFARIHDGGRFELQPVSAPRSTLRITIGQVERVQLTGGSEADLPGIDVYADTVSLTAGEARRVASHLLQLADRLEQILSAA